jgi:hypothetical protein
MTEEARRGTSASPATPTEDVQIRRLLDQFSRHLIDLRALAGRSRMEVAAIAGLRRTEIGMLENRSSALRRGDRPCLFAGREGHPREGSPCGPGGDFVVSV